MRVAGSDSQKTGSRRRRDPRHAVTELFFLFWGSLDGRATAFSLSRFAGSGAEEGALQAAVVARVLAILCWSEAVVAALSSFRVSLCFAHHLRGPKSGWRQSCGRVKQTEKLPAYPHWSGDRREVAHLHRNAMVAHQRRHKPYVHRERGSARWRSMLHCT